MSENLVSIGKILNFHGIKGDAKVGFSKGREKQIENLETVFVLKNNAYVPLTVTNVRFHKQFAIIKFKEFNTVNEVEAYKGCDIFLEKSKIEESLDTDEFLISDLIGMDVFDEDGSCMGSVIEIGENLAGNLLSIEDGNGKTHLVPFVKDLIPVVDVKNKKIVINNIEGLIS